MDKATKRFVTVVLVFFVTILSLMACARPAYAATKVDKHPVVFATTDELGSGKFKFKANTIYIEVCKGVVENKKGDGYVKGHKDWYISYRYKGHPKKGTVVTSYFPLDRNAEHEALARYDFVKTKKGKWKMIYTS